MTEDFLNECNDHDVPFRDFEAHFCARCLNKDCTRSNAGKSKFEHRIGTWEQQMFTDVPTMDGEDPRLITLQAKKFKGIEPGPPPEVGQSSAWTDPRDLPDPADLEHLPVNPPAPVIEQPEPAMVLPPEPALVTQLPALDEQVEELLAEPVPDNPAPAPSPNTLPQFLMNTPSNSGQMLGNRTPPAKVPQKDPWAPKEPAKTDGLEVVESGARIRFGGSPSSDPTPKG